MVMLPAMGSTAEAFAAHGFISAVHDRAWPIDIVVACPELDTYLDGKIAEALESDVIAPARARGYARLWLVGISLGSVGAVLYAAKSDPRVEGVVLLAPFLGTPGTIAEIASAGGLSAWSAASSRATNGERAVLRWLKDYIARAATRPALYLGFGQGDRFARGHRLLADHLWPESVVSIAGAHDWDCWADLWRKLLERQPFVRRSGDARYPPQ
jgi:pimeloyl-ACP methyl ester carboxylesterase